MPNVKIYKDQGGKRMVFGPGSEVLLQGKLSALSPGNDYYVDSGAGSNGNDGLSWQKPKATIAAALALCTANNGDRVWLAPGHNEGFGDAQLTLNVAGVSLIGVGEGSARPRIDFDHANASIDITANSVRLENITLLPSVTAVLIGIDVNAAVTDTHLVGVESLSGEDGAGVDEFALTVDIKAGCSRTLIEQCKFTQHASAAGALSNVKLTGASDYVTIRDCEMWIAGAGAVACINGDTTLSTRVRVERCLLVADNEPGIELLTGTTGVFRDLDIFTDLATIAAATVADGCAHFRVSYVEVGDESGAVVKTASAND